jgi:hypothetical protein
LAVLIVSPVNTDRFFRSRGVLVVRPVWRSADRW